MIALEIISSTLTALGVGLLLAAVAIRLIYGSWISTHAISFEHEGHAYLRWHDHRYRIIEALWSGQVEPRGTARPDPPPSGEEIGIYFHVRRPVTFSLRAPYRGTRGLAVVGLCLAVLGVLVGFLPG
ncbi:hypothetical protein E8P82_00970 [Arthrobacter echini]|uniref:DUF3592 domain-containing protein n=1 Tax=Arthrobacter echini TaxID=1529066 RepID=A0A4S5E9W3_9MICC|nr:hypothetical protein [Arthrobacter echini]THJ68517.1 hypothetical protein E8P82_00970 [Arthrobacter echini]